MYDPNSTDGAADGMKKMSTGKRERSLVAPAGILLGSQMYLQY
jgi:hypothetical protein